MSMASRCALENAQTAFLKASLVKATGRRSRFQSFGASGPVNTKREERSSKKKRMSSTHLRLVAEAHRDDDEMKLVKEGAVGEMESSLLGLDNDAGDVGEEAESLLELSLLAAVCGED